MKFPKPLVAIVLAALMIPAMHAQTRSIKADRADKTDSAASKSFFTVGERLNYEVSWSSFIVAGELTIETKDRRSFDGVDGFHVAAQAKSVGLVSALVFKVNDVYESYINASTLQPFRAEKHMRHGKKSSQTSVTLDQKSGTAKLSDGNTITIPADTYDLAGLLYAVRGMDLTVGKTRTFTLLEDNKLYTVRVEPEAREKISTRAGDYNVVRIATKTVRGGEAKDPYNLRFYVTNDSRRLPVLITAAPSWGDVRVELTSITGVPGK